MTVLMPHQLEAVTFLRERKRALLCDPPRLGKTLPTITVALERIAYAGYVLVVAPSSAKFVWRDATAAVSPAMPCLVMKTEAEVKTGPPKHFSGVIVLPWGLLKLWPLSKTTVLVLDEVHRMQSKTAQRTKAAMKLMAKADAVFALSGTLMMNRPINLWAVLTGLRINKMAWWDYAHHFCKAWIAPWGLDVSGAANLPELKALIKPHLLRRSKAQVFKNYVPPEYRLITFDRPISRRESAFDVKQLTDLPNPIVSIEGLSEVLHEAALKKLPDAIDFISGLLDEELDMKLVVFAYHTDVITELVAGLKQYRPVSVKGDTPAAMREKRRLIFQDRVECRLFIGNIIACSEAIDLSAADTVVFIETTWSSSILEQAAARVENINKPSCAALAYILTIEKSLDHYILQSILKKMKVISQVIPEVSIPNQRR